MSAPLHDDHANRGTMVIIAMPQALAREIALYASDADVTGEPLRLALEIDPELGPDRAAVKAKVGEGRWTLALGGAFASVTVQPLYDPEG